MKFTNLRIVGFKSFVDQTDFEIRDGLTGIVGPNGCGKSNLLEALRWVMGATSAKALRGGGMGDVIFAGTSMRPSRNWAEVILTLDNSDRSAPAEYNELETIEVSRRILHKDEGTQSIYRINNKDVRAKDIQLLFADAATGANSPALVRQGQISELINAKPQNRRRLLEEAAGITGLHSRRHEAELRLRAAEQNLERLEDVTGELETQKTALARQARQATRYRNLSGDIRRAEAAASYLRWKEAVDAQQSADGSLTEISALIEDTARAAVAATTAQSEAHEALDPLRVAEAEAAAGLHRLTVAREGLDEEAARARAELERLTNEIERLSSDREREKSLLQDAVDAVETLNTEENGLKSRETAEKTRLEEAQERLANANNTVETAEKVFDESSSSAAEADARRRTIASAIDDQSRRIEKISAQIATLESERASIEPTPEQSNELEQASTRFENSEMATSQAQSAYARAEEELAAAIAGEQKLSVPFRQAEQSLNELKAEADALKRVLATHMGGDWVALIEEVTVTPGFENALAAALGDDLAAGLDDNAPAHWAQRGSTSDASDLPEGAAPLSRYVIAPSQLSTRLKAIGIVAREQGARLATSLKPGQRLVSREGDLWRWDGFVAHAEAKTAAAIRLEQRNRLAALEGDFETASRRFEETQHAYNEAKTLLLSRQTVEREARRLAAETRTKVDESRISLSRLEKDFERTTSRLSAIAEAIATAQEDKVETETILGGKTSERDALPDPALLAEDVNKAREDVVDARSKATEARAAHNDLVREAEMRARRIDEIIRERSVWSTRAETAETRVAELEARLSDTSTARDNAQNAPRELEEKRIALLDRIGDSEKARSEASDALAVAQNRSQEADRIAKDADNAAAEAREARARLEAQSEAAVERVSEATSLARETCDATPEELPAIAEFKEGKEIPDREHFDAKLERYKRERENLGGVNLRADEEMQEVSERLEEIVVEREDCESAIRKLRSAIGGLNKEARQRLNEAFETVNSNFSRLFTRLFNGGQAELRMIESEDVLEAGLEIYASPPGKKLASMSLMSGGEQALTATALIFAVFMANPAPVCVLDEVDAPLDDANTERFCRLLNEMAVETETRFIIITHHALTMSRMNRLFGVTMIERGVSQLVSVDLHKAEQLAAAE